MHDHPAFNTTDCETSHVDWEKIGDKERWNWTTEQWILLNFLAFIVDQVHEADLEDLWNLDSINRQAVMLALGQLFSNTTLEENLRD
jgi:hypothetical protein